MTKLDAILSLGSISITLSTNWQLKIFVGDGSVAMLSKATSMEKNKNQIDFWPNLTHCLKDEPKLPTN